MDRPPIALQLYTVRDETARDFVGTLHRVAEIGYRAVEFAGYGGLSSSQMAGLLADTGLRAASTHVGLAALESDLDRELDYCQTIGCAALVLPWLPPEQRSPDALRALFPRLNEIGRRCHERGIAFGYHNHDFEFAQSDGKTLLDLLLGETDPLVVALEFDAYWAAYAGVDPAAYLRKQAGRALLIHVKDMSPARTFTEVGDGTLDIAGICRAAHEQNARWYIVENDQPSIPSLESAKRSLENLRAILQAL
ncbi:MAG TPA: sugar phosphate isomerase/epimerase [Ktedonobacterales bacterium]|nr:sugar phosphate isomerase/epimerase [Ktedonobacterales bacterium]